MPSLVDVDAAPVRRHEQRGDVLLGWIGSPTTAPYLDRIVPAIDEAARRDGRPWTIECVGGRPGVRPTRAELVAVPWSPEAEADLLRRMDIGLMPLPDTAVDAGQVRVQGAAVPRVGHPGGGRRRGRDRGGRRPRRKVGWWPRPSTDWPEALTALAADAGMRDRLGAHGRERVSTGYSVAARLPELAALLMGG